MLSYNGLHSKILFLHFQVRSKEQHTGPWGRVFLFALFLSQIIKKTVLTRPFANPQHFLMRHNIFLLFPPLCDRYLIELKLCFY